MVLWQALERFKVQVAFWMVNFKRLNTSNARLLSEWSCGKHLNASNERLLCWVLSFIWIIPQVAFWIVLFQALENEKGRLLSWVLFFLWIIPQVAFLNVDFILSSTLWRRLQLQLLSSTRTHGAWFILLASLGSPLPLGCSSGWLCWWSLLLPLSHCLLAWICCQWLGTPIISLGSLPATVPSPSLCTWHSCVASNTLLSPAMRLWAGTFSTREVCAHRLLSRGGQLAMGQPVVFQQCHVILACRVPGCSLLGRGGRVQEGY